jgi:hypothetical protein
MVGNRAKTAGRNPAIQGWLSHRSIASTAVYIALAPNRFKDFAGIDAELLRRKSSG